MFDPSKLKFRRNVPVSDGKWMDHFQLIRNRYLIVVVARWKNDLKTALLALNETEVNYQFFGPHMSTEKTKWHKVE